MYPLDEVDVKILKLLQVNSRLTFKEIASKLHLSTTPIFDRMKKLEKEGVIQRYVAIVDPVKIGKPLFAFVHISLKAHGKQEVEKFAKQIIDFEEVMECYHLTGEADFVLKVVVKDMAAYNQFVLEKLSVISNIGKVESRFCLSTRKYSTVIPVGD